MNPGNPSPAVGTYKSRFGFRLAIIAGVGIALFSTFPGVSPSRAGDWPQILGPHRNGTAIDEKLLASWPKNGPELAWKYSLGSGFAGPAVVADQVVIFHRVSGEERLEAINTATGKSIWQANFEATYQGSINPDSGPRCVPLIHQEHVYALGAAGDLYCVSLKNGSKVWTRRLYADYDGNEGFFGAGSSPIVSGSKLLINVGGMNNTGLVAVDLKSGKTVWKSSDEKASYSSPSLFKANGKTGVIFVTRLNAVMVAPENGQVRQLFPFGQRGPTVNAATPLVFGEHVFVTASYGIGARLVKLSGESVETIWSNNESMSSQYTTPVYHDGHIYGTHGREDIGVGELRCIVAKSGEVKWSSREFGVGHLILADGKLLILTVDGDLVLANASPKSYQELARATISSDTTRAIPALASGRLFVRDNSNNRGTLKCLRVGE